MSAYSRTVKVSSRIYVTGTTATDGNSNIVGIKDAYGQTVQVIKNIEKALQASGANVENIVRTRMFVKAETTANFSARFCPRRRWLKFQN
ncbi:MAG: Rid family hydrolase [Pyrinomonadaceae bacterium]